MKPILITTIVIVFFSINLTGQTRIIKGRVISEEFMDILPEVKIETTDSVVLGMTDKNGHFEIEISSATDTLIFLTSLCCYEKRIIKTPNDCDQVEVVIMLDMIYDFMTGKKINRDRKKRFNNLLKIHKEAFEKGIFVTEKPCYEHEFVAF